jgi:metal-responsive CopG/Arc/MetJ family transcriptional regulator
MKTVAITIDEDMLRRIDRLATKGTATIKNRSQVIRQAVREYVARIERLAEEERERKVFRRHRQLLERQAKALVEEQAKL